ncbi:MAG TPA: Mur ligase family protein [Steroidobacteraceae bacterium]
MRESGSSEGVMDFIRRGGGPAVERVYQGPVIAAAGVWRLALDRTCFIGITGSAGKTTTKELLHAALALGSRCVKSFDSDNVLYPAARTLMRVAPWTQYCVQEVGLTVAGSLEPIVRLLRPRVGVVTNIGMDHLRTLEQVAQEKGHLIACLPADGLAVLNADDELVAGMASRTRARVVTYGFGKNADYCGEIVDHSWPGRLLMRIRHGNASTLLATQLLGSYQGTNVLAAVACAHSLGAPMADVVRGIGSYLPLLGRMSVHTTERGITFIRDDFKATAWALQSALAYMAQARAARKVIVIGTVSSHGTGSAETRNYKQALSSAADAADQVLLIGPRAHAMLKRMGGSDATARMHAFEFVREASAWLGQYLRPGDLVLLKGSNRADHLARLALSVDRHVQCWRVRCGWVKFCDHCRLIDQPASR